VTGRFCCPRCGAGEDRCKDCRENGRRKRHRERIVRRELIAPGAVAYRCACECGETFTITVLVAREVAVDLVHE
jgi:hypothetical protein